MLMLATCVKCGNTVEMFGSEDMAIGTIQKADEACGEMGTEYFEDSDCRSKRFRIVHKR